VDGNCGVDMVLLYHLSFTFMTCHDLVVNNVYN